MNDVQIGEVLDVELTVQLSVQELLAILHSLDVTITTLENYSPITPDVSARLQLTWSLEQRLKAMLEEAVQ